MQVEKHIRKNNLTVTFTDQLGQAKHSEHVTGEKEARKLAFYLFWNIKPYFTRSAIHKQFSANLTHLEAFTSSEPAVEIFAIHVVWTHRGTVVQHTYSSKKRRALRALERRRVVNCRLSCPEMRCLEHHTARQLCLQ